MVIELFRRMLVFPLLLITGFAYGQMYKCSDTDGRVVFQGHPCTANHDEGRLKGVAQPRAEDVKSAEIRHQEAQQKLHSKKTVGQAYRQNKTDEDGAENDRKAYRCTRINGSTFLSAKSCPTFAVVTSKTNKPGVTASTLGHVTQTAISRTNACQEAKRNKENVESSHSKRRVKVGEQLQREINSAVSELCDQ